MQLGGTEGFWDLTAHENLVRVVYVPATPTPDYQHFPFDVQVVYIRVRPSHLKYL